MTSFASDLDWDGGGGRRSWGQRWQSAEVERTVRGSGRGTAASTGGGLVRSVGGDDVVEVRV
jgi:hypothetical protein